MRRILLAALLAVAATSPLTAREPVFTGFVVEAERLGRLETLIIARNGEVLVEKGFNGHSVSQPRNIKSASKSVMSALVGIAIDKGVLSGADERIAGTLSRDMPPEPDPRMDQITVGNLLSMQAGLGRLSGPNYGKWVASRNWVRAALAEPFEDRPGGGMLYSTASTHLLSAILTAKTGRSTLDLAHEWLADVDGFRISGWERDPQGIYLGGNQMAMTPRSLMAFGELYRNRGMAGGKQVVPADWIDQSWTPRTRSIFSGERYGYGWFIRDIDGHPTYYAWGYGGQMLYITPDLGLTVVMTSVEEASTRNGYRDELHRLMTAIVTEVVQANVGN
ncbi:MAG: serine hydrolase [Mesorhizobium sp.]